MQQTPAKYCKDHKRRMHHMCERMLVITKSYKYIWKLYMKSAYHTKNCSYQLRGDIIFDEIVS
ncbi:hypothetical protein METBIDRAFT_104486 [Metschnikowia bicuspidata var. bicuspidata NRRL YB-4993]|uniref:Uncharacterized protein n=1 Tax=Metschnikowia bicuspidata var. bicuspidata NRRL YB-4993 TaxID=869754 RepID=A0A1A0HHM2_9ASCO|nr:hypothetical protein METBIDRAFT_104486 [Metschnikowia bicuspidata var. bicuspidata NRRL YB-4993]OBA23343.1 hypothetical protein METBIDRAFT_104486 [Metschnikowia bicuspidata var. bicuspidata NRRL YB-4993]